jgi:hypothetical protein
MDTRFWGPSGWQLLHLVAANAANAANTESAATRDFLASIPSILPCKYCRQSSVEFLKELPVRKPYDRWLYTFHNKVNAKLRGQAAEDPRVIVPPPNPSFEEVKERYTGYLARTPCAPPGLDFLLTIAYNYKYTEIENKDHVYRTFFGLLADVYPYPDLRAILQEHPIEFPNVFRWMYGVAEKLCAATGSSHMLPSFSGMSQRLAFYKSGCAKKTYRGKTCRKIGGKHTKDRDNRRTYRITHKRLII